MIARTFRGVIQLIGALGAGLAIGVIYLAWLLSSGPISLAFLSPYVEEALSAGDGSFRVRFDDTILTWEGWERTLDIRVLNVRISDAGGAAVAVVPELSLSLSAQALIRGTVAPRSIELYRPSLQVVRRADGSLGVGFGTQDQGSEGVATAILAQFAQAPDESGPMGYLSRIMVREADLFIIDRRLQTSWRAPNTEVKLDRHETGIDAEVSLNLEVQKRLAHLTLLGGYQRDTERLDFGVEFADIVPAAFSQLSPKLESLSALGVPLQGTLLVSLTLGGTVEAMDFDLRGGAGRVDFPAPLAQTVRIAGLDLSGRYVGGIDEIEFDELKVDLGRTGELVLPATDGHRLPLRRIETRGTLSIPRQHLQLVSFEADLGGPTLLAVAEFASDDQGGRVSAEGVLRDVPVDEIARYWPEAWGEDPHIWVTENLSAGVVREARAEFEAVSRDGKTFEIAKLFGDMTLEGFTVDYLSPMPKAENVSGIAAFDERRFDISIREGEAFGLRLGEGLLSFIDLDKEDQILEADLTIHGDVGRALRLIDHRPLELTRAIAIDPEASRGNSSTRLQLRFPLLDELTLEMVDVGAASRMTDVTVSGVILGRDISHGDLELRADNQGMIVTGEVNLGTIRGDLEWRESFDEQVALLSSYTLRGIVDDTQRTDELGLSFAPFSRNNIQGPIGAEIQWRVMRDGTASMDAALDLSSAVLALPLFGWSKAPGIPGVADVQISLDGQKITEVSSFSIAAADLEVLGSVSFDPRTGGLARVDLSQLAFGRTDVRGALIPGADGGWTVTVHGPSFDFAPIFGDLFSFEDDDAGDAAPDVSFAIDLDRVWVSDRQSIASVNGTLARQDGKFRAVKISGQIGEKQSLEVVIEPAPDGNRQLVILGQDAGETLRTFEYYDNMVGGALEITGIFEDNIDGSPLRGQMKVTDFHVVNAPDLAHLLSIMALTGIVDVLQGQGLGFSEMEVPFVRHEGVTTIKDARVNGASLGFTASGSIYSAAEIVNIEGTVVPAYAINAALGNIPVLGTLFSGGEKGGGVFAATFKISGPRESPKITVNPLSVLAPGFMRRLFGFVDDGGGDAAEDPPVPPGSEPGN